MKRPVLFVVLLVLIGLALTPSAMAAGQAQTARQAALAGVTRASAVDPVVRVDDQTGSLEWLTGSWAAPAPGRPVESSFRFLEKYGAAFGITAPRAEFRAIAVRVDDQLRGWRDVYLGQVVDGVPVLQSRLAFHYDAAGRLVAVNGGYVPTPSAIQSAELNADQAAARAVAASATLPTADGAGELSGDATRERPTLAKPPTARLMYFVTVAGDLRLAYEIGLTGTGPEAWLVVVDARNGAILSRVSQVETAGSGIDLSGKRVSLKTSKVSGVWKLIDRSQYMYRHHSNHPYTKFEGSIEIRDSRHLVDRNGEGIPKANSPVVKDSNGDNFFNHGGSDAKKNQRSAVSLARNFSTTYKAFRARLNRNSVDGKGLSVIGNVHLGSKYENAYWHNGTKMMYFGDNKAGAPPFARALDVVAHEFGHGVTRYSVAGGGFVYLYPSGALSEAFSDIWGTMVDANDWAMGEDLGQVERDLANPTGTGLPGSMWDYHVMVNELDGGGNHVNCTIGGHFFQQLSAALPAVAPAADGRFTAARIIYRSYAYVGNLASYRDWGLALNQAATDLYGADSAQAVATRDKLVQLGIVSFAFGQNDSGWVVDPGGSIMEIQWTRAAGMCYLAEKFTRPDDMAKLARVYLALDPDPNNAWLGGQPLRVYVTGVDANGSPNLDNVLDYESLWWDGIDARLGMFTAVTMTEDDLVTPRVVDLPAQYFVLVGFDMTDGDSNTMLMLQDEGSSFPPTDQNWVISTDIDWNTLEEYFVEETLSQWSGMSYNPLNFMMRPMYWYDLGTNRAPAVAAPRKESMTISGAHAPAPAGVGGVPTFAPLAAD